MATGVLGPGPGTARLVPSAGEEVARRPIPPKVRVELHMPPSAVFFGNMRACAASVAAPYNGIGRDERAPQAAADCEQFDADTDRRNIGD